MMLLHESVVLPGGVLEIELHSNKEYRVRFGEIEYVNNKRRIGGRTLPYEFRSVEQLRYDFERDVRAAGGSLG